MILLLLVLGSVIAAILFSKEQLPLAGLVVSLTALLVSIISSLREAIFPFQLKLLTNEVTFAPQTRPSHESPALVLPVVFLNSGYGTGVVEAIAIKIEGPAAIMLYTPIAEIDFRTFLAGRRRLHAENLLGSFSPFILQEKEVLKKHILFSQEERSGKYPFTKWVEGPYIFRVIVKHSSAKKPVECATFERNVSAKMLADYSAGTGFTLIESRELDL